MRYLEKTMTGKSNMDWRILNTRVVYENLPWLRLTEQAVRLPNGVIIEKYLISDTPDVVMMFAVTEAGEAIFVEQYKHGMRRLSLDLSAGYIDDDDESPLAAARRELEEETGYVSEEWMYLASLVVDPNRSAAQIHYYLATGCRLAGVRHLDATEELNVHVIPLSEVESLALTGRVTTVSSAAGIALGMQSLRLTRPDSPAPDA
jgi:ADP-ribose pyrophosphatase